MCAAVGHKKFGGKTFIDEALELFEENFFNSKDDEIKLVVNEQE